MICDLPADQLGRGQAEFVHQHISKNWTICEAALPVAGFFRRRVSHVFYTGKLMHETLPTPAQITSRSAWEAPDRKWVFQIGPSVRQPSQQQPSAGNEHLVFARGLPFQLTWSQIGQPLEAGSSCTKGSTVFCMPSMANTTIPVPVPTICISLILVPRRNTVLLAFSPKRMKHQHLTRITMLGLIIKPCDCSKNEH